MAKRILYYYVEIMREMDKQGEKNCKVEKLPIIYPIVLYTGKTKWTAQIELMELQDKIKGIKRALTLSYNLVDINKYTKEEMEGKVVYNMVTENLRNIFRMNYNEGVAEGIKNATHNFIIQMLKNKMSEKAIKEITQIDEKELQEIKKELSVK